MVELGLYEASVKLYADLTAQGLQHGTAEWNRAVEAELATQRQAAAARLWPEIPQRRYLCFYPMNKFRGETKNWYSEPIRERQRMMREHGMIGRHYAGRVTQIISDPSASMTGNGASIFLPTIRWFLKSSFMKCASTKPAPFTACSALFCRASFSFGAAGKFVRRQDAELYLNFSQIGLLSWLIGDPSRWRSHALERQSHRHHRRRPRHRQSIRPALRRRRRSCRRCRHRRWRRRSDGQSDRR